MQELFTLCLLLVTKRRPRCLFMGVKRVNIEVHTIQMADGLAKRYVTTFPGGKNPVSLF